MSDSLLIRNRRIEVEREIELHRAAIKTLQDEIAELAIAEAVMARLAGAERSQPGEGDANEAAAAGGGKPEGTPTMPEMILAIMSDDARRYVGWEPKEVADEVRKRWWPEAKGAYVSSIMWRMTQQNRLAKSDDSAKYFLPFRGQKVEAADDVPSPDPSAASDPTYAEGPETPGGGG